MKTILVDVTAFDARDIVLKAATHLAEKSDAHVVGLYVTHARLALTGLYSWSSPYKHPDTSSVEKVWQAKAKKAFTDAFENSGLSHEFRHIRAMSDAPIDALIAQTRLADLFITGIDTDWNDNAVAQSAALGQIVEGSGRPILIMPETTGPDPQFETVSIGWDGSRESTRAIFDAIPILRHYSHCSLISANVDMSDTDRMRQSANRMIDTLGRHGINASFKNLKAHGSDIKTLRRVGEASDLMVLGAYSHTRLRQRIFGGVTDSVLKNPPCPVLLSH